MHQTHSHTEAGCIKLTELPVLGFHARGFYIEQRLSAETPKHHTFWMPGRRQIRFTNDPLLDYNARTVVGQKH